MRKTINLNGHNFEVIKSKHTNTLELAYYSGRTLMDCYERPSYTKVAIYKEWEEWAYLNNVLHFGVCSYNTFGFSLQGLVEHGGHTYMLRITPNHNYAYIVE